LLKDALLQPNTIFTKISEDDLPTIDAVLKLTAPLILLPPVCAWIGSSLFGWRLSVDNPIHMENTTRIVISFLYLNALVIGYAATVFIAEWMAQTYGNDKIKNRSLFAFFTVVLIPLIIASFAHLYPNILFNVLVLIPGLIWSITLLYKGLPIVLQIPPERGMLMSSALLAWLLVAVVSLLGISVGLWTYGIGPRLGI
jgi:hypothetical protein